jgi:mono/diheme cytochrome c family protein
MTTASLSVEDLTMVKRLIRTFFAIVLACSACNALAADDVSRSGKELYERYCASCHGNAGRGDGPVSKSLRVEVPDLTRYAQRHGDLFDRDLVERIIDGRHVIGAHGSRTMPVWGEDLSKAQLGNPDAERGTRLEITRLADYLRQLQRPSPASRNDK